MNPSLYTITDSELMKISSQNPELRFERNTDGTLETMAPTGGISGNREARAIIYLGIWVERENLGQVFASSTGFKLSNGAIRSPDVAFVSRERLPEGWDEGEDEFLNLAPDFVIEIRSKTDSLKKSQDKMLEYIANGVRLGWLIDRQNQQAWVYRADGSITQYPATATLTGEEIVPGFTIALKLLI